MRARDIELELAARLVPPTNISSVPIDEIGAIITIPAPVVTPPVSTPGVTGAPNPSKYLSITSLSESVPNLGAPFKGDYLTIGSDSSIRSTQSTVITSTVAPVSVTITPTLGSCATQSCSARVVAFTDFVAPPASVTVQQTTGSCSTKSCSPTAIAFSQYISALPPSASVTIVPTTGTCATQSCAATVVPVSRLLPANVPTAVVTTIVKYVICL